MSIEEMQDILESELGVSAETVSIICDINGYSEETMRDILYAVTGYRDFDQLEE